MTDFDLVVRGDLVLPDRVLEQGWLAISEGRIAAIGVGAPPSARNGVLDRRRHWILPAVVDGQTHSGSQANQEGIGIATRAAAAGGVGTIVDMPYDDPQPVVDADLFRAKVAVVEQTAHVDVALYGTIARDDGVPAIPGLIEAGACGFKFSTYQSHPTRFPRISPPDMLEAFRLVAPTGLACGVHNENQDIVDRLSATLRQAGVTGPEAHGLSRPPIAELLAIAEVYEIGAATGCRAHIVHCSVSRGFELCRAYRQQGFETSIETCVHYLTLSDEDMTRLGALAKINPPLRPPAEIEALWRHVAAGEVDFVSSDHVAWSLDRKRDPDIFKNASGVPGLETLLPAFVTGARRRGLPLTTVARHLSEGPARHFRLYPRKGALRAGADADLVVLEPGSFAFDASTTQTAVDWSPYDGLVFSARVAETLVRGELVWDGADVLSKPGYGQFLRPAKGTNA